MENLKTSMKSNNSQLVKNVKSNGLEYLGPHDYVAGSGKCCVCQQNTHKARVYFGRLFCINCFNKYIYTKNKKEPTQEIIAKLEGDEIGAN